VFCLTADLVLDQLAEDHPDYFAAVRYHGWWPAQNDPFYVFNPSENGSRIAYYGINGVPHVQLDGIFDAGIAPSLWWSYIQNMQNQESPLEITLGGEFDQDSRQGRLDITIVATGALMFADLKTRIALVESGIHFDAPNGVEIHDQVMRDMIPHPYGLNLSIFQGDTVFQAQDFSCPSPLVISECELIVWVQSHAGHDVLQTARIRLDQLEPTGVAQDDFSIPDVFGLTQNYPNPFNALTRISFKIPETMPVNLTLYDLLGRQVQVLVDRKMQAGTHQILFDGSWLPSGLYFYRLQAGSRIATKKLTLLK